MNATPVTNATRPHPSQISFAPECFEVVGTRTVWTTRGALFAPDVRRESEEAARAYGMRRNYRVHSFQEDIKVRVRWN